MVDFPPRIDYNVSHTNQQNDAVTEALLSLAEASCSNIEIIQITVLNRIKEMSDNFQKICSAMRNFDGKIRWTGSSCWNKEKVFARCNQVVTKEMLETIQEASKHELKDVKEAFRQLSGRQAVPRSKFLMLRNDLKELEYHQDPSQHRIADSTAALYELQYVDFKEEIESIFQSYASEKGDALKKVNESEYHYSVAVESGDIQHIETVKKLLIDSQYNLCEVMSKMMSMLKGYSNHNTFEKVRDEIVGEVDAATGDFDRYHQNLQQRLNDDLRKCAQAKDEEGRNPIHALHCKNTLDTFLNRLNLSSAVQSDIFEKILQLINSLHDEVVKRRELICEFIQVKTDEAHHISVYEDFLQLIKEREDALNQSKRYSENCSSMVPIIYDFKEKVLHRLPKIQFKDMIQDSIILHTEEFLKFYRSFVFSCGDLTTKKMHHVDVLERQVRLMTHSCDTATESLDPNTNQYLQEKDHLIQKIRAIVSLLTNLNRLQDGGESLFSDAAHTLQYHVSQERFKDSCGVSEKNSFTHPLHELGIKASEERQQFINRLIRYIKEEEEILLHKRSQILSIKNKINTINNQYLTDVNRNNFQP